MYNQVQEDIENMPDNIMNFPMLDVNSKLILFKKISEGEPLEWE